MRRRCIWCQEPPLHEIAVLKWRDEDRERLTTDDLSFVDSNKLEW